MGNNPWQEEIERLEKGEEKEEWVKKKNPWEEELKRLESRRNQQ